MTNAEEIIQKLDYLKKSRYNYEEAWMDVRAYVMPETPPITGGSVTPGKHSSLTYDTTAKIGLRNLSSVMMASITNPSTQWVHIECDDDELNTDKAAKEYFEKVEKYVNRSIENSNCYKKLGEFYRSFAGFGTAFLHIEKGRNGEALNFDTFHISECYIDEDYQGTVDTLFREFVMTARQLVQQFGIENLSDDVKKAYEKEPYKDITIVHAVFPREEREIANSGEYKQDKSNMPWASVFVELEKRHLIKEGGFKIFPFAVARWAKESGERYGHGPVIDLLPDIRVINSMAKARLHLAEKVTNPPTALRGLESAELDLSPGAPNIFDDEMEVQFLIQGANFPITNDVYERQVRVINDGMFVNQLYQISMIDKEMTAREVSARQTENLRIMGPTFTIVQDELLEPSINMMIYSLATNDDFPKAPEALKGKEFKYRFVNPLSRAQRYDESRAIQNIVYQAFELSQYKPEIIDNIDMDKAFRKMMENSGAPLNITREENEVKKIRVQRAQQQQKQQEIQEAAIQTDLAETQAKTQEKQARAAKYRREAS